MLKCASILLVRRASEGSQLCTARVGTCYAAMSSGLAMWSSHMQPLFITFLPQTATRKPPQGWNCGRCGYVWFIYFVSVLAKASETRHTKCKNCQHAATACNCFEQRHEQSVSGEMKVVPCLKIEKRWKKTCLLIIRIFLSPRILAASKTAESTKRHLQ